MRAGVGSKPSGFGALYIVVKSAKEFSCRRFGRADSESSSCWLFLPWLRNRPCCEYISMRLKRMRILCTETKCGDGKAFHSVPEFLSSAVVLLNPWLRSKIPQPVGDLLLVDVKVEIQMRKYDWGLQRARSWASSFALSFTARCKSNRLAPSVSY